MQQHFSETNPPADVDDSATHALNPSPADPPGDPPKTDQAQPLECRQPKADVSPKAAALAALKCLDQAVALPLSCFPDLAGTNKSARPLSTIPNVRQLLHAYGIAVRYNEVKKRIEILVDGHLVRVENAESIALTRIASLAVLNHMSKDGLERMLEVLAFENRYNPAADWINSRTWDGEDRLENFYATIVVQEYFPDSFKCVLMRKWLLSAVAAALLGDSFSSRGVLTLQGQQGIGKTRWTRALVSDPLLRSELIKGDQHIDPGNKDTILTAISHWITEIGELDSSLKKDVARLKGFLTSDRDKIRPPYGSADSDFPRRTVFCATVNEDTFLVDSTGNSRFWTLPCVTIQHDHGIDMQQVFAQLKVDVDSGATWWLTPEEDQLLDTLNRAHQAVSVIRELVFSAVEGPGESSASPLSASEVLRRLNVARPTNNEARECGAALRALCGDPTVIHGTSKWRVKFRASTLQSLNQWSSASSWKSMPNEDDIPY